MACARPLHLGFQSQWDCSQEAPGGCIHPSSTHHTVHSRVRSLMAPTCLSTLSCLPQEALSPPSCRWLSWVSVHSQTPSIREGSWRGAWGGQPACQCCQDWLAGHSSGGKVVGTGWIRQEGCVSTAFALGSPRMCHCSSPGNGSQSCCHGKHHRAPSLHCLLPQPLRHRAKQTFPCSMVVGRSLCQSLRAHLCFLAGHRP